MGPDTRQKSPKTKLKRPFCIKVYLTRQELIDYATEAQKAGKRPKGLKVFKEVPSEFEPVPQSKGIGKFVRECLFPCWKYSEAERLAKKREIRRQAEELGMRIEDL